MPYCGWQLLQKNVTRFNPIAPIFQKFSGGTCPHTPLEGQHALSALSALYGYPINTYTQPPKLFDLPPPPVT